MTDDPFEPEQENWADQAVPENNSVREEIEGAAPILVLGLIPLTLVMMLLSLIVGDWIFKLVPVLVMGGFWGFIIWRLYRHHMDSKEPFVIPGHGSFTGEKKKRLVIGGSIVVFILMVAVPFAEIWAARWFIVFRDWVMGWTVPWPW